MNDNTYTLPAGTETVAHGLDVSAILRDMADKREFNQADALAASGDFFITLATKLDMLAQSMPRDSAEQIELENLIQVLFYLQKHYRVIAKHKLQ